MTYDDNKFEEFLKEYVDKVRPEGDEVRRQRIIMDKLDDLQMKSSQLNKVYDIFKIDNDTFSISVKNKTYISMSSRGIEYPQSRIYRFKQWLKKFLAVE